MRSGFQFPRGLTDEEGSLLSVPTLTNFQFPRGLTQEYHVLVFRAPQRELSIP